MATSRGDRREAGCQETEHRARALRSCGIDDHEIERPERKVCEKRAHDGLAMTLTLVGQERSALDVYLPRRAASADLHLR